MAAVKVKGVVCNCNPGTHDKAYMVEIEERQKYHGIAPSTGKPRWTNYYACENCGHTIAITFDVEDPVPVPKAATKRFAHGKEVVGGNGERMDRQDRREMRKAKRLAKKGIEAVE